jgi:hypothetical protein
MLRLIRWLAIVSLVAFYGIVLFAVLHPNVSPSYREYFIDRTSSDYEPPHYEATPEQGMSFSQRELPQWVHAVRGFELREEWGTVGRFTDDDLGVTPGIIFNRTFDGEVCVEFSAYGVSSLAGQTVGIRMGSQEKEFRLRPGSFSEYQLQFTQLRQADHLDILLPKHIPAVIEADHKWADPRRLGMSISTLKLIPGKCSLAQESAEHP